MNQKSERQNPIAQNLAGDEIDRAMRRNGIRPGSPLEANIRARAYDIWGSALTTDRDSRLDAYIAEQRTSSGFASSFIPSQTKLRIPRGDLDRLREHFTEIAQGKVLVE